MGLAFPYSSPKRSEYVQTQYTRCWSKCRRRSYGLYRSSENRLEHRSELTGLASSTKVVGQQAVIIIRDLPGFFCSSTQTKEIYETDQKRSPNSVGF
jgi:hypothetical protein